MSFFLLFFDFSITSRNLEPEFLKTLFTEVSLYPEDCLALVDSEGITTFGETVDTIGRLLKGLQTKTLTARTDMGFAISENKRETCEHEEYKRIGEIEKL